MKIIKSVWAVLAVTAMFLSCKQGETQEESATRESAPATASASNDTGQTAGDTIKKLTDTRKLIRTADLKFKVKDVAKSTTVIEIATRKFGGLITKSDLKSQVSNREETQFSQDSTLVSTTFTVENDMVIRVPNAALDTVVKSIAAEIDFLDLRVIKADDVALQLLSAELLQKRKSQQQRRMENAIDRKGRKLDQIVAAEDQLANKNEDSDNAKLGNLALMHQIAYSTITLQIYQPETMRKELTASMIAPRSHIGLQLLHSIQTGWYILEDILAFIVRLWSLIAIALFGILVYKKWIIKTKPVL